MRREKLNIPLVLEEITDAQMQVLTATAEDWDKYYNSDQWENVFFHDWIWYATLNTEASYYLLVEWRGSGDFATNGWVAVNDWTNDWYVWTADPYQWTYSAYISRNGWTDNLYNRTVAQISHLYVDIEVPAWATEVRVQFAWMANWQSWSDDLSIYTAPDTFTPVAWTNPSWTWVTSHWYVQWYSTFTVFGVNLPASFEWDTMRLIFSWENDGSLWNQPPANIDNIIVSCKM